MKLCALNITKNIVSIELDKDAREVVVTSGKQIKMNLEQLEC